MLFKTESCKKCPPSNSPTPNYLCPYFHNASDKRRHPNNESYSGIYLEDSFDSKQCLNYVEYLYHPDNYKRVKCKSSCKKYMICPFYHDLKDFG